MTKRPPPPPADAETDVPRQLAETLGRVCRQRRKELGLTQTAVAKSIGISWEFYSRIERGRALPSVPTLAALAQSLDVSVDYMLGRETEMPAHSPATQRIIRLLQRASPRTLRVVSVLLKELVTIDKAHQEDA